MLCERIIEEIGITFVGRYKQRTNFEFDVRFIRLLLYGRILSPASKIETINKIIIIILKS